MGRTVTPAYRVEYKDNLLAMGNTLSDGRSRVDGQRVLIQAWSRKPHATPRPTDKNLEAWRIAMNKSFAAGGVNEHISEAFGAVAHIYWARIVRQRDDAVVAEVNMPTFEVA